MRAYKTTRYKCDYCEKRGGQKPAMARHEGHCTMNPARSCGMCEIIDEGGSIPLAELIEIMDKRWALLVFDEYHFMTNHDEVTNGLLDELRNKTNNCPACILAAIRQGLGDDKTPWFFDSRFDFKKEGNEIMKQFYEDQHDHAEYC